MLRMQPQLITAPISLWAWVSLCQARRRQQRPCHCPTRDHWPMGTLAAAAAAAAAVAAHQNMICCAPFSSA